MITFTYLNVSTSMSADDVINKKHSYVLAYFDGETPTYQFPKGYKVGFKASGLYGANTHELALQARNNAKLKQSFQ